jgi:hypothetical protein
MSNKVVQTNKLEKKDSEVPTREIDKVSGFFSFENEINKIKIPIPLVELKKKPNLSKADYQSDRRFKARKPI